MATRTTPRIDVQVRDKVGRRATASLREQGMLPAVIYGHKKDPVHVAVKHREFTDLLHQHTHLLEVAIDATVEPCLVKDIQWDHLGTTVIHVDLTRVDLTERVTVSVALDLVGQAAGLKEAGTILDHPLSEIEVTCLASNIPDAIRVDVRELDIDQSITIGQLDLPEGVDAAGNPNTIIAAVKMLSITEDDEEEPAEGAGNEPEIIGKPAEETAEGAS